MSRNLHPLSELVPGGLDITWHYADGKTTKIEYRKGGELLTLRRGDEDIPCEVGKFVAATKYGTELAFRTKDDALRFVREYMRAPAETLDWT